MAAKLSDLLQKTRHGSSGCVSVGDGPVLRFLAELDPDSVFRSDTAHRPRKRCNQGKEDRLKSLCRGVRAKAPLRRFCCKSDEWLYR